MGRRKKTDGRAAEKSLKTDRRLVDRALRKYLKAVKGPASIKRAMAYAVMSGGKRLRPILALETAKMFGAPPAGVLDFACAVEFVHNFSLVQDDLPSMDDDNTRRGKPACHKKFDEATAILAGDALLILAYEILSRTGEKKALKTISLLSEAIGAGNMIGGQALDLECRNGAGKSGSLGTRIDRMKTAALMAASCEMGAVAAGAGSGSIKRAKAFGENLGLAFQIADDLEDSENRSSSAKSRRRLAAFIENAKKNVEPFGKKADTLKFIADHILQRGIPHA